jgi:apolipoprotein N-acyltransferase
MPSFAWVAMVPLGLALHGARPVQGLALGWAFGFSSWLLCTSWLPAAVSLKLEAISPVVWPGFLLFCAFYGIPYAIYGLFFSKFKWGESIAGAFKSALFLSVLLYFFPHVMPGNLAHALYCRPLLIQLAEIGGVPLILFMLLAFNGLLTTAVIGAAANKVKSVSALLSAGIIFIFVVSYGHFRLNALNSGSSENPGKSIRVGLVQPDIPVTWWQRPEDEESLIGRLPSLSFMLSNSHKGLDLIVWPEVPVPFSYTEDAIHRRIIEKIVGETGIPLLVSSGYVYDGKFKGKGRRPYYNAVEYITKEGLAGSYYKRKLFPFGEYLPLESSLPFMRNLFPGGLFYKSGKEAKVFRIKEGVNVIPLICYEAAFPEMVADGAVALGGNLIVNPVNDGWFGDSKASEFHLALAVFRTVEYRMPLVRAANSGISAVVEATGELKPESRTALHEENTLAQTVRVSGGQTIYARYGRPIIGASGLLCVFFLVKDALRGRRRGGG